MIYFACRMKSMRQSLVSIRGFKRDVNRFFEKSNQKAAGAEPQMPMIESNRKGNKMVTKLLFDLDGTLTDPKEGICRSVQYALHAFGIEEPDLDKLEPFIGPPLMDSFMEFYGMTKERAAEAVTKYRERFSVTGWSENVVYDGIPHVLENLRKAGYVLAVASSKPTVFVEKILKHFGLRDAFSVVVGSELDGRRVGKDEVIEETLRRLFAEDGESDATGSDVTKDCSPNAKTAGAPRYDDLLMIGDRKFDVEGAHAHGIRCVGVAYGYALPGELKRAQADFIVDSPDELLELLLKLREPDSKGCEPEEISDCADSNNADGSDSKIGKPDSKARKPETKGGMRHA